ncbi:MAG: geranylgeranylglycerol-phosphate geranylgeranyltransferase [Cyclobacteriaceae bacterium]
MSIRLRDVIGFFIASRIPNLLIISYTQFATAKYLMGMSSRNVLDVNFLLLLLSTGMIGAGGYIINDYFDQKIDMINRPHQVVVGTDLRRRLAIVAHVSLSLGGIVLGFLVDPMIGAIHIFSAGALFTYSGGIRRVLLLSTLTVSFLTILTILLVMVFYREMNILALIYALFGCAVVFIRETLKDIISSKGEQAFGIQSVPIVWGLRGAKLVIYLVCMAGISLLTVYLLSVPNWTVRLFFGVLLPFMLWFIYTLARAHQLQDFKKLKMFIDVIIIGGLVSMSLV